MGIRHLNRYLRTNCPDSIRNINIADLGGKTIVVDASIYMYKFEGDNMLLENMYLMLSIFRHYNIIPIFIFDGKPPPEKNALLNIRKETKEQARSEFDSLTNILTNDNDILTDTGKQDIISQLDKLKKQFITLTKYKIQSVKELIEAFGVSHFTAEGEADIVCVNMVLSKRAWACLSEDMDLFVYGCSRVLRYFGLSSHTAILYSMHGILNDLSLTQNEFRLLCIICGTDYNINANGENDNLELSNTFKLYYKYRNIKVEKTFDEWLHETTGNILDRELITDISNMFCTKNIDLKMIKNIRIINTPINDYEIMRLMEPEGFIFVDK